DGLHNFIDGVLIAAAFLTDFHLGIEVTPDDTAPHVVADDRRGCDPHPEPPHRDPGVADDPACRDVDRIDVEQPAAPDRRRETDRLDENVGRAGAADDAIDR
ncbi:MAG: hypothetical protein EBS56_12925, partial [Planctomycetia bacterium]|nr:hypothetical protein [Planctomycetia bacterium]